MTDEQILERMGELREELFKLRFRGAMMELENPQLPQTDPPGDRPDEDDPPGARAPGES
jgi:hypothetical protein